MIELKAFTASTNKTASVDSSLKIFSTVCIAASNPASYPAHTCSDPADEIPSFLIADAMTFPVIWRRVSSTPTGRKPGFLTRGMSRHATNASMETVDTSSVQIVVIKYAIVLQDLRLYRQFEHRIFLELSASVLEGPDPPLVLVAAYYFLVDTHKHNLVDSLWNTCQ